MLSSLDTGDAKAYEQSVTISNGWTWNALEPERWLSGRWWTEIDITTSAQGRRP